VTRGDSALQHVGNRQNRAEAPRGDRHTEDGVQSAEGANGFHLASVLSKDESILDGANSH
jgi:hypothetical protein